MRASAHSGMLKVTGRYLKMSLLGKNRHRPDCKRTCLLWLNGSVQNADFTAAHGSPRRAKDGDASIPPSMPYIGNFSVCRSNKTHFYDFTDLQLVSQRRLEVLTVNTGDGSKCFSGLSPVKGS